MQNLRSLCQPFPLIFQNFGLEPEMGCTDLPQFALCLSRSPARKWWTSTRKTCWRQKCRISCCSLSVLNIVSIQYTLTLLVKLERQEISDQLFCRTLMECSEACRCNESNKEQKIVRSVTRRQSSSSSSKNCRFRWGKALESKKEPSVV